MAGALLASPAEAQVAFNVNGTFSDGAFLSGSFTTSDDFSRVLDFSLTTTPGIGGPGFTYTRPTSGAGSYPWGNNGAVSGYEFNNSAYNSINYNMLVLLSPADINRNTSVELNSYSGERSVTNQFRTLTGSITPVTGAVPEPATWGMMILGMAAVGYAMRRRQKVTVSYAA